MLRTKNKSLIVKIHLIQYPEQLAYVFIYISTDALVVETLRTSTALPGAPLTSFFESLSPLQKQLLIQQQFQQIPSTATKDFSQSLPNQRIPANSGLNFQHSSVWFPNTRQTGTGTGTQQFENNKSLQGIRKNGNCVKYFEKVIIYKS